MITNFNPLNNSTKRKSNKPETPHNYFSINCSRFVDEKEPRVRSQFHKSSKTFPKNIDHDYIYKLTFHGQIM